MRKVRAFDYMLAFVIVCIAMTLAVVVAFAAPPVADADGVGRALDEQAAGSFPASARPSILRRGWSTFGLAGTADRNVSPAAANLRTRVLDLVEPRAVPPDRESL